MVIPKSSGIAHVLRADLEVVGVNTTIEPMAIPPPARACYRSWKIGSRRRSPSTAPRNRIVTHLGVGADEDETAPGIGRQEGEPTRLRGAIKIATGRARPVLIEGSRAGRRIRRHLRAGRTPIPPKRLVSNTGLLRVTSLAVRGPHPGARIKGAGVGATRRIGEGVRPRSRPGHVPHAPHGRRRTQTRMGALGGA